MVIFSPVGIFNSLLELIMNTCIYEHTHDKGKYWISYHLVREAVTMGIVLPYWIKTAENSAAILTKPLPGTSFLTLTDAI